MQAAGRAVCLVALVGCTGDITGAPGDPDGGAAGVDAHALAVDGNVPIDAPVSEPGALLGDYRLTYDYV